MDTRLNPSKIKDINFLLKKVLSKTDDKLFPKFIFFIGAGCSISSGVPSGKQLIELLKKFCFLRSQNIHTFNLSNGVNNFNSGFQELIDNSPSLKRKFLQFIETKEKEFLAKIIKDKEFLFETFPINLKHLPKHKKDEKKFQHLLLEDTAYSNWFEAFSSDSRERQKLIEQLIRTISPNSGYLILANLIRHGKIHTILTTNFDDLINDALLKFCNLKSRIYAHNEIADYLLFDNKTPNIIKLHGDFLYEDIRNILAETYSLGEKLSKHIRDIFKTYGLVIVGYNGSDYSVMKELENSKFKGEKFPLIWCDLDKNQLNWRTVNLINNTANSYFVEIPNFDELVTKMISKYKIPIQSLIDTTRNHQLFFRTKIKEFKSFTIRKSNLLTSQEKRYLEKSIKIIEVLEKANEISDPNERIKLYNEAIKLEKNNSEYYCFKGIAYMDKARRYNAPQYYKVAIRNLNKSISLNPKDYRGYFYRGCSELLNKQYKQSLQSFTHSIELNQFFSLSFNNRGLSNMRLKQYNEALKDFSKAISIDPTDADFYNNIAVTYRHMKNYSDGIIAIKKAIQIDPDFSFLYGTMAELYAGLNDSINFYKSVNKALSMNYPIFEFINEVEEYKPFLSSRKFKNLLNSYKVEYYLR